MDGGVAVWWQEHWAELLMLVTVALAWGRLSQQVSSNAAANQEGLYEVRKSIDALTAKVVEQNGRVRNNEIAIARLAENNHRRGTK